MKDYLKTIAGAAAVGAVFTASAAAAQDIHEDFAATENSSLFASMDCIENALRQTFGQEIAIDNNFEYGLIMGEQWVNGNPVLAEVYLGYEEAVASLNVTMIDGLATMTANNGAPEFMAPPQGTASLFYRGTEGVSQFSLQGYDQKPLENYINKLDHEIRACSTHALAMS